MRFTAELVAHATQRMNPLGEREITLRGYKIGAIENTGTLKDGFVAPSTGGARGWGGGGQGGGSRLTLDRPGAPRSVLRAARRRGRFGPAVARGDLGGPVVGSTAWT